MSQWRVVCGVRTQRRVAAGGGRGRIYMLHMAYMQYMACRHRHSKLLVLVLVCSILARTRHTAPAANITRLLSF